MSKTILALILFLTLIYPASLETTHSQALNVKIIGRGNASRMSWSPDGSRLAITSSQGLWFYNDQLEEVGTIPLGGVVDMQWSHSSRFLALTYFNAQDRRISLIWDVQKEDTFIELGENISYTWHPTEEIIITDQNNHASLIDVTTNTELQTFTVDNDQRFADVYWREDGQQILFAVVDENISYQLWDVARGEVLDTFTPPRYDGTEKGLVWNSATNQILRYTTNDSEIEIMDITTSEIINVFPAIDSVRFSFNRNNLLMAYEKKNHSVEIVDLTDGERTILSGHEDAGLELEWNSGHYLATSGNDGRTIVWDIRSGDVVFETIRDAETYADLAWHPHGNLLVMSTGDSLVLLIDVENATILNTEHHFTTAIETMNWSQAGNYIVVSSGDDISYPDKITRTQVWDVSSGELVEDTERAWTPNFPIQNTSIFVSQYEQLAINRIYWNLEGDEYVINRDDGVERWNTNENRLVFRVDDVCMLEASVDIIYIEPCRENQILDIGNNQIIVDLSTSGLRLPFHPTQNLYGVLGRNEVTKNFTIDLFSLSDNSLVSELAITANITNIEGPWHIGDYGWNRKGNLFWISTSLPGSPVALTNYALLDTQHNRVLASGPYDMIRTQLHPSEYLVAGVAELEEDVETVQIRDMLTQEVLYEYPLELYNDVWGLRWSPDGSQLAIADRYGIVHIWNYNG